MKLIALVDRNWGIAKDGKQVYYIPDDLSRFRVLTEGGSIVLGRKTLLNFPDRKPLKGRKNYILSHKVGMMDGAIICRGVSDIPKDVLRDGWCVGGESVYRQLLPYCDRAFITVVDADLLADQFCPNLDNNKEWEKVEERKYKWHGTMKYKYVDYRKKGGTGEAKPNDRQN